MKIQVCIKSIGLQKNKKVLDFFENPWYYTTCVRDDAGVVQW